MAVQEMRRVLPLVWSDNDITLWPGESETLTATYDASQLQGATPVVSLYGWNVSRFDVPGPDQG
jgi:exo-1,4-beta-D-glucosaminidase